MVWIGEGANVRPHHKAEGICCQFLSNLNHENMHWTSECSILGANIKAGVINTWVVYPKMKKNAALTITNNGLAIDSNFNGLRWWMSYADMPFTPVINVQWLLNTYLLSVEFAAWTDFTFAGSVFSTTRYSFERHRIYVLWLQGSNSHE